MFLISNVHCFLLCISLNFLKHIYIKRTLQYLVFISYLIYVVTVCKKG
jgi:hypothetical protein